MPRRGEESDIEPLLLALRDAAERARPTRRPREGCVWKLQIDVVETDEGLRVEGRWVEVPPEDVEQ